MNTSMQKTMLVSSIALTLGATSAQAALVTNVLGPYDWSTDSANFTALSPNGGILGGPGEVGVGTGGSNDWVMTWDGNAYNASSDYTGPGGAVNVTAYQASTTGFFGHAWIAHDIQMFTPGSYSFDTTIGGGNPESGTLSATVGAGQLGMHFLWDWNGNLNVDAFVVLAQNSVFGSGLLYSTVKNSKGELTCSSAYTGTITKNCLYDAPNYGSAGAPVKDQVWMLAATDGDGDGVMGNPSATGGPTAGFNYVFNANLTATPDPVPLPASAWLFGSGLMGLVAAARHRKRRETEVS